MKTEMTIYSIQEVNEKSGMNILSIEKYQSDIYLFIASDIKRVHDGEAKFYIADTITPNVINVNEAKELNDLHSFHYGLSTPIIIVDEDQNVIKQYLISSWILEDY